jgi:hypothetical protein
MSSLFNITKDHLELVNALIENGGELTDEIQTALQISEAELRQKSESYAYVIKQLNSDIIAIDTEMQRLKKLTQAREKAITRMEDALLQAMEAYDIQKIETPLLKLSIRNTEAVEILDEDLISAEFKKEKITCTIDKTAIKNAIKNGEMVIGATIKQNRHLNIK